MPTQPDLSALFFLCLLTSFYFFTFVKWNLFSRRGTCICHVTSKKKRVISVARCDPHFPCEEKGKERNISLSPFIYAQRRRKRTISANVVGNSIFGRPGTFACMVQGACVCLYAGMCFCVFLLCLCSRLCLKPMFFCVRARPCFI